ncbi:MAG: molybdopterin-binding protein, partial [Cyanobacteria bacterium]|nr:molybdopterin-binding protein [Cyanobacteriota bacterium]MDW8203259.1 molybdopterin-binding protein [Cyanobacteriota bacterium SKYGB_h_bin112]
MAQPHPDVEPRSLNCAVVTVSDTRTEVDDRSGQLIRDVLQTAGHQVVAYRIVKDEPEQIATYLQVLCEDESTDAVIFNGG